MHGQLPIRLEALLSARERSVCFGGGKEGECFNLLIGGRVYGRETGRIHVPQFCLQSSTGEVEAIALPNGRRLAFAAVNRRTPQKIHRPFVSGVEALTLRKTRNVRILTR